MTIEESEQAYYPYQVPAHIRNEAERQAVERRKTTGEDIKWSNIIREVLDLWLSQQK